MAACTGKTDTLFGKNNMTPLPTPLDFWYGYAPSIMEFMAMIVFAFWWILAIGAAFLLIGLVALAVFLVHVWMNK